MQKGLARVFSAACLDYTREARLSAGDRVDFLVRLPCGAVAVECKVKGAPHEVLLQLGRYAAHPGVDAVILVTSRSMRMPGVVGDKPLHVVLTSRAWL